MKRIATLILAAGLVLGSVVGASAIDFKAKGQWLMQFDLGAGAKGYDRSMGNTVYGYDGSDDSFAATQRVRLQLEAVASESLSGTVYFEMGNTTWGQASSGGALGADGKIVEVKQAYLDWIIPNTDVKVRMGIQGLGLPSYTTNTSMIFNNDVAGVVVSNKFNDNVALTAFWARPYNNNYSNSNSGANQRHSQSDDTSNYLDNVDVFGLVLPVTMDGFAVVPWITYANVGQNFTRDGWNASSGESIDGGPQQASYVAHHVAPFGAAAALTGSSSVLDNNLLPYGDVWNVGLTGEVTMADPFRFAWDLNYGYSNFGQVKGVTLDNAKRNVVDEPTKDFDVKREGFYGSLLAEYKMEWGTPGLYMWYSTGDDGDPYNGSERIPTLGNMNSDMGFSNFAGSGAPYLNREGILGTNLIGTWGLGLRVKDFSFVEDLTHTLRFNYFQGTNSPTMARYLNGGGVGNDTAFTGTGFDTGNGLYLTTQDSAFEIGLSTNYEIYENLDMYVEAAYLILDFDNSNEVWDNNFNATDAWNLGVTFAYSF